MESILQGGGVATGDAKVIRGVTAVLRNVKSSTSMSSLSVIDVIPDDCYLFGLTPIAIKATWPCEFYPNYPMLTVNLYKQDVYPYDFAYRFVGDKYDVNDFKFVFDAFCVPKSGIGMDSNSKLVWQAAKEDWNKLLEFTGQRY